MIINNKEMYLSPLLSTHSLRQLVDKIVMHLTTQSWICSHFFHLAFYLGRRLPPNLVHPK